MQPIVKAPAQFNGSSGSISDVQLLSQPKNINLPQNPISHDESINCHELSNKSDTFPCNSESNNVVSDNNNEKLSSFGLGITPFRRLLFNNNSNVSTGHDVIPSNTNCTERHSSSSTSSTPICRINDHQKAINTININKDNTDNKYNKTTTSTTNTNNNNICNSTYSKTTPILLQRKSISRSQLNESTFEIAMRTTHAWRVPHTNVNDNSHSNAEGISFATGSYPKETYRPAVTFLTKHLKDIYPFSSNNNNNNNNINGNDKRPKRRNADDVSSLVTSWVSSQQRQDWQNEESNNNNINNDNDNNYSNNNDNNTISGSATDDTDTNNSSDFSDTSDDNSNDKRSSTATTVISPSLNYIDISGQTSSRGIYGNSDRKGSNLSSTSCINTYNNCPFDDGSPLDIRGEEVPAAKHLDYIFTVTSQRTPVFDSPLQCAAHLSFKHCCETFDPKARDWNEEFQAAWEEKESRPAAFINTQDNYYNKRQLQRLLCDFDALAGSLTRNLVDNVHMSGLVPVMDVTAAVVEAFANISALQKGTASDSSVPDTNINNNKININNINDEDDVNTNACLVLFLKALIYNDTTMMSDIEQYLLYGGKQLTHETLSSNHFDADNDDNADNNNNTTKYNNSNKCTSGMMEETKEKQQLPQIMSRRAPNSHTLLQNPTTFESVLEMRRWWRMNAQQQQQEQQQEQQQAEEQHEEKSNVTQKQLQIICPPTPSTSTTTTTTTPITTNSNSSYLNNTTNRFNITFTNVTSSNSIRSPSPNSPFDNIPTHTNLTPNVKVTETFANFRPFSTTKMGIKKREQTLIAGQSAIASSIPTSDHTKYPAVCDSPITAEVTSLNINDSQEAPMYNNRKNCMIDLGIKSRMNSMNNDSQKRSMSVNIDTAKKHNLQNVSRSHSVSAQTFPTIFKITSDTSFIHTVTDRDENNNKNNNKKSNNNRNHTSSVKSNSTNCYRYGNVFIKKWVTSEEIAIAKALQACTRAMFISSVPCLTFPLMSLHIYRGVLVTAMAIFPLKMFAPAVEIGNRSNSLAGLYNSKSTKNNKNDNINGTFLYDHEKDKVQRSSGREDAGSNPMGIRGWYDTNNNTNNTNSISICTSTKPTYPLMMHISREVYRFDCVEDIPFYRRVHQYVRRLGEALNMLPVDVTRCAEKRALLSKKKVNDAIQPSVGDGMCQRGTGRNNSYISNPLNDSKKSDNRLVTSQDDDERREDKEELQIIRDIINEMPPAPCERQFKIVGVEVLEAADTRLYVINSLGLLPPLLTLGANRRRFINSNNSNTKANDNTNDEEVLHKEERGDDVDTYTELYRHNMIYQCLKIKERSYEKDMFNKLIKEVENNRMGENTKKKNKENDDNGSDVSDGSTENYTNAFSKCREPIDQKIISKLKKKAIFLSKVYSAKRFLCSTKRRLEHVVMSPALSPYMHPPYNSYERSCQFVSRLFLKLVKDILFSSDVRGGGTAMMQAAAAADLGVTATSVNSSLGYTRGKVNLGKYKNNINNNNKSYTEAAHSSTAPFSPHIRNYQGIHGLHSFLQDQMVQLIHSCGVNLHLMGVILKLLILGENAWRTETEMSLGLPAKHIMRRRESIRRNKNDGTFHFTVGVHYSSDVAIDDEEQSLRLDGDSELVEAAVTALCVEMVSRTAKTLLYREMNRIGESSLEDVANDGVCNTTEGGSGTRPSSAPKALSRYDNETVLRVLTSLLGSLIGIKDANSDSYDYNNRNTYRNDANVRRPSDTITADSEANEKENKLNKKFDSMFLPLMAEKYCFNIFLASKTSSPKKPDTPNATPFETTDVSDSYQMQEEDNEADCLFEDHEEDKCLVAAIKQIVAAEPSRILRRICDLCGIVLSKGVVEEVVVLGSSNNLSNVMNFKSKMSYLRPLLAIDTSRPDELIRHSDGFVLSRLMPLRLDYYSRQGRTVAVTARIDNSSSNVQRGSPMRTVLRSVAEVRLSLLKDIKNARRQQLDDADKINSKYFYNLFNLRADELELENKLKLESSGTLKESSGVESSVWKPINCRNINNMKTEGLPSSPRPHQIQGDPSLQNTITKQGEDVDTKLNKQHPSVIRDNHLMTFQGTLAKHDHNKPPKSLITPATNDTIPTENLEKNDLRECSLNYSQPITEKQRDRVWAFFNALVLNLKKCYAGRHIDVAMANLSTTISTVMSLQLHQHLEIGNRYFMQSNQMSSERNTILLNMLSRCIIGAISYHNKVEKNKNITDREIFAPDSYHESYYSFDHTKNNTVLPLDIIRKPFVHSISVDDLSREAVKFNNFIEFGYVTDLNTNNSSKYKAQASALGRFSQKNSYRCADGNLRYFIKSPTKNRSYHHLSPNNKSPKPIRVNYFQKFLDEKYPPGTNNCLLVDSMIDLALGYMCFYEDSEDSDYINNKQDDLRSNQHGQWNRRRHGAGEGNDERNCSSEWVDDDTDYEEDKLWAMYDDDGENDCEESQNKKNKKATSVTIFDVDRITDYLVKICKNGNSQLNDNSTLIHTNEPDIDIIMKIRAMRQFPMMRKRHNFLEKALKWLSRATNGTNISFNAEEIYIRKLQDCRRDLIVELKTLKDRVVELLPSVLTINTTPMNPKESYGSSSTLNDTRNLSLSNTFSNQMAITGLQWPSLSTGTNSRSSRRKSIERSTLTQDSGDRPESASVLSPTSALPCTANTPFIKCIHPTSRPTSHDVHQHRNSIGSFNFKNSTPNISLNASEGLGALSPFNLEFFPSLGLDNRIQHTSNVGKRILKEYPKCSTPIDSSLILRAIKGKKHLHHQFKSCLRELLDVFDRPIEYPTMGMTHIRTLIKLYILQGQVKVKQYDNAFKRYPVGMGMDVEINEGQDVHRSERVPLNRKKSPPHVQMRSFSFNSSCEPVLHGSVLSPHDPTLPGSTSRFGNDYKDKLLSHILDDRNNAMYMKLLLEDKKMVLEFLYMKLYESQTFFISGMINTNKSSPKEYRISVSSEFELQLLSGLIDICEKTKELQKELFYGDYIPMLKKQENKNPSIKNHNNKKNNDYGVRATKDGKGDQSGSPKAQEKYKYYEMMNIPPLVTSKQLLPIVSRTLRNIKPSPNSNSMLQRLATILVDDEEYESSTKCLWKLFSRTSVVYGSQSLEVANVINFLSYAYLRWDLVKYGAFCETLAKEAMLITEAVTGHFSVSYLVSVNNFGALLIARGSYSQASRLMHQALNRCFVKLSFPDVTGSNAQHKSSGDWRAFPSVGDDSVPFTQDHPIIINLQENIILLKSKYRDKAIVFIQQVWRAYRRRKAVNFYIMAAARLLQRVSRGFRRRCDIRRCPTPREAYPYIFGASHALLSESLYPNIKERDWTVEYQQALAAYRSSTLLSSEADAAHEGRVKRIEAEFDQVARGYVQDIEMGFVVVSDTDDEYRSTHINYENINNDDESSTWSSTYNTMNLHHRPSPGNNNNNMFPSEDSVVSDNFSSNNSSNIEDDSRSMSPEGKLSLPLPGTDQRCYRYGNTVITLWGGGMTNNSNQNINNNVAIASPFVIGLPLSTDQSITTSHDSQNSEALAKTNSEIRAAAEAEHYPALLYEIIQQCLKSEVPMLCVPMTTVIRGNITKRIYVVQSLVPVSTSIVASGTADGKENIIRSQQNENNAKNNNSTNNNTGASIKNVNIDKQGNDDKNLDNARVLRGPEARVLRGPEARITYTYCDDGVSIPTSTGGVETAVLQLYTHISRSLIANANDFALTHQQRPGHNVHDNNNGDKCDSSEGTTIIKIEEDIMTAGLVPLTPLTWGEPVITDDNSDCLTIDQQQKKHENDVRFSARLLGVEVIRGADERYYLTNVFGMMRALWRPVGYTGQVPYLTLRAVGLAKESNFVLHPSVLTKIPTHKANDNNIINRKLSSNISSSPFDCAFYSRDNMTSSPINFEDRSPVMRIPLFNRMTLSSSFLRRVMADKYHPKTIFQFLQLLGSTSRNDSSDNISVSESTNTTPTISTNNTINTNNSATLALHRSVNTTFCYTSTTFVRNLFSVVLKRLNINTNAPYQKTTSLNGTLRTTTALNQPVNTLPLVLMNAHTHPLLQANLTIFTPIKLLQPHMEQMSTSSSPRTLSAGTSTTDLLGCQKLVPSSQSSCTASEQTSHIDVKSQVKYVAMFEPSLPGMCTSGAQESPFPKRGNMSAVGYHVLGGSTAINSTLYASSFSIGDNQYLQESIGSSISNFFIGYEGTDDTPQQHISHEGPLKGAVNRSTATIIVPPSLHDASPHMPTSPTSLSIIHQLSVNASLGVFNPFKTVYSQVQAMCNKSLFDEATLFCEELLLRLSKHYDRLWGIESPDYGVTSTLESTIVKESKSSYIDNNNYLFGRRVCGMSDKEDCYYQSLSKLIVDYSKKNQYGSSSRTPCDSSNEASLKGEDNSSEISETTAASSKYNESNDDPKTLSLLTQPPNIITDKASKALSQSHSNPEVSYQPSATTGKVELPIVIDNILHTITSIPSLPFPIKWMFPAAYPAKGFCEVYQERPYIVYAGAGDSEFASIFILHTLAKVHVASGKLSLALLCYKQVVKAYIKHASYVGTTIRILDEIGLACIHLLDVEKAVVAYMDALSLCKNYIIAKTGYSRCSIGLTDGMMDSSIRGAQEGISNIYSSDAWKTAMPASRCTMRANIYTGELLLIPYLGLLRCHIAAHHSKNKSPQQRNKPSSISVNDTNTNNNNNKNIDIPVPMAEMLQNITEISRHSWQTDKLADFLTTSATHFLKIKDYPTAAALAVEAKTVIMNYYGTKLTIPYVKCLVGESQVYFLWNTHLFGSKCQQSLEEAISILLRISPFSQLLGSVRNNYGCLLMQLKNFGAAREQFRIAEEILSQLATNKDTNKNNNIEINKIRKNMKVLGNRILLQCVVRIQAMVRGHQCRMKREREQREDDPLGFAEMLREKLISALILLEKEEMTSRIIILDEEEERIEKDVIRKAWRMKGKGVNNNSNVNNSNVNNSNVNNGQFFSDVKPVEKKVVEPIDTERIIRKSTEIDKGNNNNSNNINNNVNNNIINNIQTSCIIHYLKNIRKLLFTSEIAWINDIMLFVKYREEMDRDVIILEQYNNYNVIKDEIVRILTVSTVNSNNKCDIEIENKEVNKPLSLAPMGNTYIKPDKESTQYTEDRKKSNEIIREKISSNSNSNTDNRQSALQYSRMETASRRLPNNISNSPNHRHPPFASSHKFNNNNKKI